MKGAPNVAKIIYRTQVSLNGLIEMPGETPDWVTVDEELFRYLSNLERQVGGYLWGRRMYENTQALWSTADPRSMRDYEVEFFQITKQIPRIVFSSTLEQVGENARLERGDPVEVVTRLKEQLGQVLSVGGVQLASTLMQAGLIDEYHIFFQPIILSAGRPLYQGLNEAVRLKLVETHVFQTGVVYLRYQSR
jgi:dihydrofolate reductase